MSTDKNIPLKMIRENLEDIPQFALAKGFSIQWFQPGDEKVWQRIQSEADKFNKITPDLFGKQFGGDASLLSRRQCYLFDPNGNAAGTATAWFNDHFEGTRVGRVHWVAILPEHQGKGLGKALMTVTCNRLRELGHQRTYLSTSSARIPAVNLYLKFGFVPFVRSEVEQKVWEEVLPLIKR